MGAFTNVDSSINFNFNALESIKPQASISNEISGASIPIQVPKSPGQALANKPAKSLRTEVLRCTNKLEKILAQKETELLASRSQENAVTATGEVDTVRYGYVLEVRQLVGVRGVGKTYGGYYYVDMDCLQQQTCPPPQLLEPAINYRAKDYASFRQLILDRLSLVMPDWEERHVPDLGITLVEVLAYVGDYLSYYQDAVATEAYLETARQRISVRGHARLIDYPMHEGCNARTWLWLETSDDISLEPKNFYFITNYQNAPPFGTILEDIPPSSYEVFEPLTPLQIHLYNAHNQILFYTWGDVCDGLLYETLRECQRSCCLPRGSTTATLVDEYINPIQPEKANSSNSQLPEQQRKLHLKVSDILIFEEIRSPKTGIPEDADMNHRHAVRLTSVKASVGQLSVQPKQRILVNLAVFDSTTNQLFPAQLAILSPQVPDTLILKELKS
ncbi:MAG: hypothetical protein V7K81_21200 [Nostoc sp.]